MGCVIFLILVVIVIVVLVAQKDNGTEAARRAYVEALGRLKLDPANPDLRAETLRLGREYSALTRKNRNVTLFDEVALLNDINAACAAVSVQRPHAPPPPQTPTASIEDRLTRLHDLKTRGLISEAEYDGRRREILRDT
ncbi:MAG TPA: hypothetical protein VN605_02210 [Thermoanaerobaculia bacterium]|nr:hypothetical protein [Thermoanaerobaculia bacterium]